MATALFISVDELKKHSILGGNIDTAKLIPAIKAVQELEVHTLLGTDLYNKISDYIIAGDVPEPYLTLKNSYIHPYLVHAATAYYIPFASYTILNSGIGKQNGGETRESVSLQESTYLANKEENISDEYKLRLINFLKYHHSDYPEYLTNTNEEITPDKEQNLTNWYLGGTYPDNSERYIDHD